MLMKFRRSAFIDCAVGRGDCRFGVSANAMNDRAGTIGINDKTASRTVRASREGAEINGGNIEFFHLTSAERGIYIIMYIFAL